MTTPQSFWDWFVENEERLFLAGEGAMDEILLHLHRVVPGTGVEISDPMNDRRELILTTKGKPLLAASIVDLVAYAPSLLRWTLTALKPPRGFDFVFESRDGRIDPRELSFEPLEGADTPGRIGIRVFTNDLAALPMLRQTIAEIIETGIGERAAAAIDHIEVARLVAPAHDQIPLTDLTKYLEWCRPGPASSH